MTTPRRGFQSRAPRRIVDWGLGPAVAVESFTVASTSIWTLGTTPSQNLTVVRTRGIAHVILTAAAAIGDGFNGAFGIYMMTEDAFAAGDASALDPVDDANSDMWLWHHYFSVKAVTGTISDGVNAASCSHRIEIDSKAMRKNFDPERVMVGVTQVVEQGTATMEIFAETRQLFKS